MNWIQITIIIGAGLLSKFDEGDFRSFVVISLILIAYYMSKRHDR